MTRRWALWTLVTVCAAATAAGAGTLRVTVTPVVTRVQVGGSVRFAATVHDEENRLARAGRVAWTVSGGGTVTPQGVFQARTAGTHIVTASVPNTDVAGTATVVVSQERVGQVASLVVAPSEVSVAAGRSAWFFATPYDAQGRPVAAAVRWRASGGTMSPSGLFTAQKPGTHTIEATVQGTRLSGTAQAVVTGGGGAPQGEASIKVQKWELSDRFLEVRARVEAVVSGPRLQEVRLYAIEVGGDDDRLDAQRCQDGARVRLSGKYSKLTTRHLELRLYDAAGKVVAKVRREAR